MFRFLPVVAAGLIALSAGGGNAHAQNSNPFAMTTSKSAWVTISPSCSPATTGCYIIPAKANGRT